jgi:nitroreductase / dihydropteridine reductase
MNVSEIAQRRYTTKAFDPNKRISDADMGQLRAVLLNAPSSVNSQPWHFVIASSPEGKSQVAQGMVGNYAYNQAKVLNASHVIVLCAQNMLNDDHLTTVLHQEESDGRFPTQDARMNQDKLRRNFVELHRSQRGDERQWIESQVYLALGSFLFAAGAMDIDACPMEGFDSVALDQALRLADKKLHSVAVIALGYRSEGDFNAKLPKSRLPAHSVISEI